MGEEQIGSGRIEPCALALADLPDRIRLPIAVDLAGLRQDLARVGSVEWTRHFVEQNYDGDWSVLPLRAPAGATHPILQITANPATHLWESTEWLEACPNFKELLAIFQCKLEAVRLMRLSPGSFIKKHCDERLAAEWGHARLHIPIVSDAAVDFRLNGVRVIMAPGEVWYLRLADPHEVVNASACDRVHLVVDAVVNPWLIAVLLQGARASV